MSKLDELKEQLAALQKEIDHLEAQKELPWSYVPDNGDLYYRIYCDEIEEGVWLNGAFDNGCVKIGNCFETLEQAEKELETRKVVAELRRCEGVKRFETGGSNFGIYIYWFGLGSVNISCWTDRTGAFAEVYFESEEYVQSAIQKVGSDRIVSAAKWMSMGE
jgi:hypothetical protein